MVPAEKTEQALGVYDDDGRLLSHFTTLLLFCQGYCRCERARPVHPPTRCLPSCCPWCERHGVGHMPRASMNNVLEVYNVLADAHGLSVWQLNHEDAQVALGECSSHACRTAAGREQMQSITAITRRVVVVVWLAGAPDANGQFPGTSDLTCTAIVNDLINASGGEYLGDQGCIGVGHDAVFKTFLHVRSCVALVSSKWPSHGGLTHTRHTISMKMKASTSTKML